ncbi:disease resistance protein RPV1 [Jatropha curcas]|nr:disease resistance protein RPV1 [Jatropha curcas]
MSDDNVVPPPAALRLNYDVFLSFRGEDTRHGIIENLFNSLHSHGVRVFKDDVGMSQGDEIAPTLMEAIEDSAASIIMVSRRYADSHWCLKELSRICQLRRLVLPVFYQVDPSDVRRQKGPFEDDFRAHVERFGQDEVVEWRKAMAKVGGLSGFVFSGSQEQGLIQRLVKRILTELGRTVGLSTYTVGLESRVEKLMDLLNVKSNQIQVLGLHGMGGIGKTTLAKALYNKLIKHFKYRCFISSVREIAEGDGGLTSLQNKFLHDLSANKVPPVNEVVDGVIKIKRMLAEQRVLAVLDDVNDVSQLNVLAGKRDWFGEGGIIIITTRNEDVLVDHIVNERYEVRELFSSEALQLFSYHAMRRENPTEGYLKIAKQIVSLTGNLPLALEVFGSFLFHKRTMKQWEDALKRLQQIRPHDLQDVLRISFDGLDQEERHIFLDIACLFVKIGMGKEEAIDILTGCGFRAETAVTVLEAKSLIKIREDGTLWMHDQLRDMGREIVLRENLVNPGMRSRLWDYEEIMTVLKDKKGTENVKGIILDFGKKMFREDSSTDTVFCNYFLTAPNLTSAIAYMKRKWTRLLCLPEGIEKEKEAIVSTKSFESMVNLRLLHVNRVKLDGKFKFLPAGLRWLQWKECPLKNLPYDYDPSQLSVLDLSESGIERIWSWGSSKVAEKLMVLNLHHCYNLVAIPDLYGHKSLEKINLERCIRLTKIHKSLGNLRTLLHLNLKECLNLVEFPSEVSGLKCLQSFILSGCSKLTALPDDIGSMKSLKELLVDRTAISKLPESMYRLTKLEKLSLNGCRFIKRLPSTLGKLNSLKELSLDETALEEVPDSIGSLSNLEELSLRWCTLLATIPDSVGQLQSLSAIYINNSSIKELPNSISSLSYLKQLSAGGCSSLCKLPDSIEGLSSISELELDRTSITTLPEQIGALKLIEKLSLRNCTLIRNLPEAIGKMLGLTDLQLFGANIIELPESIGMLENLVMLNLNECKQLQKLPTSIGNLKSLHHLLMEKTAVNELPESFGMLCSLMVLKMRKRPVKSLSTQEKPVLLPTSFPHLYRLEELDARAWRISGEIPDDFEKLSMLETLDLGYNDFSSLPCSLKGLSLLKLLYLPHCKKLVRLPPLPSSLKELDVSNCIALESMSDISNLESLKLLNLTNCEKLLEIPGLEHLKSLTRLYMSDCRACSLSVKRRLSKVCLRNLENLSIPGSKIPDWFSQQTVTYTEQKNCEIKAVMIYAVVSLDHRVPDDLRDEIPALPAIKAKLYNLNELAICDNTPVLLGVPRSDEDHILICRYPEYHPLVSRLRNGYKLEVTASQIIEGVQLKKCGIYLVSENDDDYDGNEESLDQSQLSLSAKLAKFFNSIEEEDGQTCSS